MGDQKSESNHITTPPAVLALYISAAFFGGGGIVSTLEPNLQQGALQACYDNSQTALNVAAQHGDEFVEIRADIAKLDDKIDDRTKYRWTAEDQAGHEIDVAKQLSEVYRRLIWLEERAK